MRTYTISMLLFCACTDHTNPYNDNLTDSQLPARGGDATKAWIANGYYRQWHCEPAAHPGRPPSPHGSNRICSNDKLSASTGPLPMGVASVKEIYTGSQISGYAVYRKDEDEGWYWFESSGSKVTVADHNVDGCVSCHSHAPHELAFTIVP
jgi:hypothetical protein